MEQILAAQNSAVIKWNGDRAPVVLFLAKEIINFHLMSQIPRKHSLRLTSFVDKAFLEKTPLKHS